MNKEEADEADFEDLENGPENNFNAAGGGDLLPNPENSLGRVKRVAGAT